MIHSSSLIMWTSPKAKDIMMLNMEPCGTRHGVVFSRAFLRYVHVSCMCMCMCTCTCTCVHVHVQYMHMYMRNCKCTCTFTVRNREK